MQINSEKCQPYCLFNLIADLSEQNDLVNDSSYNALAQSMIERLAYHGGTGGPSAWLWGDDVNLYQTKVSELCANSIKSGFLEPLDASCAA